MPLLYSMSPRGPSERQGWQFGSAMLRGEQSTPQCKLCKCCDNLDLDRLFERRGYEHHHSLSALAKCATQKKCPLCKFFLRAVEQKCETSAELGEFEAEIARKRRWYDGFSSMQASRSCHFFEPNFSIIAGFVREIGFMVLWRVHGKGSWDIQVREISTYFQVLTQPYDPLSSIFQFRCLGPNPRDHECLDLDKRWLDNCLSIHSACVKVESATLPTRVIDVGAPPTYGNPIPHIPHSYGDPFLHVSRDESGKWAALSHCWGDSTTYITCIDNLAERQDSMPLTSMPKIFQDAVILTRHLGLRYLWIDSLCIIQDSPSDWSTEAAKMADIYRQAQVTIMAAASSGSNGGIFRQRELDIPAITVPAFRRSTKTRGELIVPTSQLEPPYEPLYEPPSKPSPSAPLRKRAWALQEEILSVRKLIYDENEFFWSCQMCRLSETAPEDIFQTEGPYNPPSLQTESIILQNEASFRPDEDLQKVFLKWWYKTLEEFWRRNITFQSDRLPAIEGLANACAERTHLRYRRWIWLDDIHSGLLWNTKGHASRSPKGRSKVPSWSWASVVWRRHVSDSHKETLTRDAHLPGHDMELLMPHMGQEEASEELSDCLIMNGFWQPIDAEVLMKPQPIFNTDKFKTLLDMLPDEAYVEKAESSTSAHQIICSMDDNSIAAEIEDIKQLAKLGVIYFQISKWTHRVAWRIHDPKQNRE